MRVAVIGAGPAGMTAALQLSRGGAQVSEKHANFLINTGDATAADIEGLGEDVRAAVVGMADGFAQASGRPTLVNLHTAVIGQRPPLDLGALASRNPASSADAAISERRPVWFDGGWRDTPVYQRDRLPREARFTGPAIVEQLDCTTVIEPGDRVSLDALGNLIVEP